MLLSKKNIYYLNKENNTVIKIITRNCIIKIFNFKIDICYCCWTIHISNLFKRKGTAKSQKNFPFFSILNLLYTIINYVFETFDNENLICFLILITMHFKKLEEKRSRRKTLHSLDKYFEKTFTQTTHSNLIRKAEKKKNMHINFFWKLTENYWFFFGRIFLFSLHI